MKAPDYENKMKRKESMCFKKNKKKMQIYATEKRERERERDQDDEVSMTYSVYYSI